jgi:hypothetical protein
MDQGELAADHLAVCASQLALSMDGGPKLSNRLADECDRIAAKGKQIQAKQDAEEKRKDDAYDKTRSKAAK